jgi:hypothetical protein
VPILASFYRSGRAGQWASASVVVETRQGTFDLD